MPCGATACVRDVICERIGFADLCCLNEATGECGLVLGNECRPTPGNHQVCPPYQSTLPPFFELAGCCIEETNECGLVDTIGTGDCVSLMEVSAAIGIEPVDCDGNPIINSSSGGT